MNKVFLMSINEVKTMAIHVSLKHKPAQCNAHKVQLVKTYLENIAGYESYPNGNSGYSDDAVNRFCKLFPATLIKKETGDAYTVGYRAIDPMALTYQDIRVLEKIIETGDYYHHRFNNFNDIIKMEAPLWYSIENNSARMKHKTIINRIDVIIVDMIKSIKSGKLKPDFNEAVHTSTVARLPIDIANYSYDFCVYRAGDGKLTVGGSYLTTPSGKKVYLPLNGFSI